MDVLFFANLSAFKPLAKPTGAIESSVRCSKTKRTPLFSFTAQLSQSNHYLLRIAHPLVVALQPLAHL